MFRTAASSVNEWPTAVANEIRESASHAFEETPNLICLAVGSPARRFNSVSDLDTSDFCAQALYWHRVWK